MQWYIPIANIHAHKIGTPWYKKEILKDLNEEVDNTTAKVDGFNTSIYISGQITQRWGGGEINGKTLSFNLLNQIRVQWRPTRPSRTNTPKNVLFIIRNWITKVGSQETPGVTGKFGLGVWKEARKRWIKFCQGNVLVIANTLWQQHKRRLYTWTSPDGRH